MLVTPPAREMHPNYGEERIIPSSPSFVSPETFRSRKKAGDDNRADAAAAVPPRAVNQALSSFPPLNTLE